MLSGPIRLTLMIGPAVPVPVPAAVLEALQSVQVTSAAGKPSGFQLSFNLSHKSPLHTIFLLTGGSGIPLIRVVIVVTIGGVTEVLMDGVMTNHEVAPGADAGHSTLTVTGTDLTQVMDYIDFTGFPYPAMPPEARVLVVLAKYAMFGFIPMIIPSVLLDVPIPTQRIPLHHGTDLCYVKQLADEVGYVFYLDPGPEPGTNRAYWGPEIRIGAPQPALNINMDAHTNVESLNFTFNSDAAELPVVTIQEPFSKAPISIPVPDITPLNPPLGLIPPFPKQIRHVETSSKYSPVRAALIALTKAAKSADTLSSSGSLNVLRYGRVLKSRRLVGVRGAGTAFDGLYYVTSVTHQLKRGEYKQNFTLARNGLISTVPRVPA